MTREELKEHCEKQIEMCEMWAISKGEKPSGKIYEEHKLILELLEQQLTPQEPMREFTEEEAKAYSKALDKMYKSTGFNVFDDPCEDAISRKDAYKIVMMPDTPYGKHKGTLIRELPPVTPQQKYGKWILADEQNKEDVENDNYRFICSECQCSDIHAKGAIVPYCWKCGAKMQESEDKG